MVRETSHLDSIFSVEVNEQEVIDTCKGLRSGAAAGYDDISMKIVKQTIDLSSHPLANLINLSV